MNASLVDTLPVGRRWQYEPKWDGLRCLAFTQHPIFQLSPATRQIDIARRWLQILGKEIDGIVAKRLDLKYQSGGRSGTRKVRRHCTADCVVEEARSRG